MDNLRVFQTKNKGRGVKTIKPIKKGQLIEECPCIKLPAEDVKKLEGTLLESFIFETKSGKGCLIALGYGSLYNHSLEPNARYEKQDEQVNFYALKNIKENEEITINYNGTPEDKTEISFNDDGTWDYE